MHSNTHRHRLPASLAVYAISCLSALAAPCTLQPDTTATHLQLQELTVNGDSGTGTRVRSNGSIEIALGRVAGMIQAFGEDDVMRHLKMMPGIEGNSDYSSGISVDGTDFSHSVCRIGGAPVFFPYHFGGIFSTFNSRHFTTTRLHRNCGGAAGTSRIGAMVDFGVPLTHPDTVPTGTVSAGLINSGISLRLPVSKRLSVRVSSRLSYFNMLYSKLLKNDESATRYRFHDLNVTATYTPGASDCLQLNLFENRDHLEYDELVTDMDVSLRWNNRLASLQWAHTAPSWQWQQCAFVSTFSSRLELGIIEFGMSMPSTITQAGSGGLLTLRRNTKWLFSYEAGYTHSAPQNVLVRGYDSNTTSAQSHLTFSSLHLSLAAECEIRLSEALSLSPWCKVAAYRQGSYHTIDAQPGATLSISRNENFLTLALGRAVQYLHQVGLSEIGMTSNFWIPSTSAIKPQKAWSATAQWVRPLPQGRLGRFRLSAHAYARLLTNAHEYSGDLLSLITSDYRATDHIITGKGYAWGLGAMLSHESNRLSGWASYAFGVSRLRFPTLSHKMNPSSLDPGHSFTIFGRYKLSRRLHGSASWHIASGRRITPITQIYIIADKVMTEHGERNCAHLPTYHRLDLSLIYHFTTSTPCSHHPLQHQLSFTLFNAYGKRNVEMQTFVINPTTGNYHLKSPKSLYHFLPSLSYAISF